MLRVLSAAGLAVAAAATLAAQSAPPAQQPPPQSQAPVFRSGVDVIRLDVSVLDKDRRPVRGLTADNFTVLENGRPQRIVAVTEIAQEEGDPPTSAWMRHVPPDVAANDLTDMAGDGRFVAIIMDDWNIPFDDAAIVLNARLVGRYLVDSLGPSDVAAVVFPQEAGKTEDFTTDRRRLIAAIDKFDPPEVRWIAPRPMGMGPGGGDMLQRFAPALMRTECQRSQPTVPTLETVVARLATVPNRRKTVILVSVGLPLTLADTRGCPGELGDILKSTFRRAQQANVNIYSIDPAGQDGYAQYLQNPIRRGGRPAERTMNQPAAERAARTRREFLQMVADHTGARAIVSTDDLGHEIDRMFTEAASYYLVGYQTSNGQPDGKFRKIEVRVNRGGLLVRTRSGFYAPEEDGSSRGRTNGPAPNDLGLAGLSSPAALALRAQAVPLGRLSAPEGQVDVAVVLGVRTVGSRASGADTLTLVRTLYDAEGRAGPPAQEKIDVVLQPTSSDELRYEVFQRMALAPGRYELRLNATSAALDASGTVFATIEVPDVARRRLSLSGVLIGRRRAAGDQDALARWLSVVPTTARDFANGDPAVAVAMVSQGGADPVAPVAIDAQVLNAADELVWTTTVDLPADAFGDGRHAPVELTLPLDTLRRGAHLLSLSATLADGTRARSDVVFRVR